MAVLLAGLTVWRISYMLVIESGPSGIFDTARLKTKHLSFIPLQCLLCTSVWVALPVTFLFGLPWFYFLAISAIAILIDGLYGVWV